MTTRALGDEYHTTLVCVDACQSGVLSGRFYNRFLSEGKSFRCLTEFLQVMEHMLDTLDFPRAYTQCRSFISVPPVLERAAEDNRIGGMEATFAVRIQFRQNSSWQGSVKWLEGGQELRFRSALELVCMISNVLTCRIPS